MSGAPTRFYMNIRTMLPPEWHEITDSKRTAVWHYVVCSRLHRAYTYAFAYGSCAGPRLARATARKDVFTYIYTFPLRHFEGYIEAFSPIVSRRLSSIIRDFAVRS